MITILAYLFFFVSALFLALMEINEEGKNGWAENLATWFRVTSPSAKIWMKIQGGKPLTEYHLMTTLFAISVFLTYFIMKGEWSISSFLSIAAAFFAWLVLWDFLWFIFNPHYGIKNFKRNTVWWHSTSKWVMGVPIDYINGWIFSIILAFVAGWLSGQPDLLATHIAGLLLWLILIFISIAFLAPPYMSWHRRMMLERDERSLVRISHTLPPWAGVELRISQENKKD